jgi:transposase-like protein
VEKVEKVKRLRALSSMSDIEFDTKFPNEKTAIDHFLHIRYNGNMSCPHCGSKIQIYRERKRLKVFHCSICNNSFSPIKDTIFEKTHIPIITWFKIIRNFLNDRKGYSACHVERDIGVTYKTAWRMLQQIRKAMTNKEIEKVFEVLVEVDETYVGGKPRKGNAILDKKGNIISSGKRPPLKRGRGTKKIPVVGIKERSTGRVYAKVMLPNEEGKKLTGKQLLDVIETVVKDKTKVITDDFRSYGILNSKANSPKYFHFKVCHSKGQYNAGNGVHTNGIENFWSIFKRGIIGVYHHISEKYLQRYVDEFCFRQNTRLEKGMFDILLDQCILADNVFLEKAA